MYSVDEQKCDGCGACVEECSLEAIAVVDGRARIDQRRCTECGLCEYACPREAIRVVEP